MTDASPFTRPTVMHGYPLDQAEKAAIAHALRPEPPTTPKTIEHNRWIVLSVLCTGMLMIVLDATAVDVALPSIRADLGFSQASLALVLDAYMIAFGGLLLFAGYLGERIGHKYLFMAGLGVFTVASLLCGVAQSQELLVAARFVQGAGGAMISVAVLRLIIAIFSEPREQMKAIGVYGFVASAGGSVGLLAGGVLTQAVNWHWIFLMNVPIGIAIAVPASRLLVRKQEIGLGGKADLLGAMLITGALMLSVYTIVKPAAQDGWGSRGALTLGAASLMLFVVFVLHEVRAWYPMIPLRIFRSRNISGANLIQVLLVAVMFGMFFLGALYLQRVLRYSALEVGLAFLPVTIARVLPVSSVAYRLASRFGARITLLPGLALVAAGLVLLSQVPVNGSYVRDVLPGVVLLGFGFGISFSALTALAMWDAERTDAGLVLSILTSLAQLGGALSATVLAALSSTHSDRLIAGGATTMSALTSGYRLAFLVAAGFMVLAIVVVVTILKPSSHVTERAASEETGILAKPLSALVS